MLRSKVSKNSGLAEQNAGAENSMSIKSYVRMA